MRSSRQSASPGDLAAARLEGDADSCKTQTNLGRHGTRVSRGCERCKGNRLPFFGVPAEEEEKRLVVGSGFLFPVDRERCRRRSLSLADLGPLRRRPPCWQECRPTAVMSRGSVRLRSVVRLSQSWIGRPPAQFSLLGWPQAPWPAPPPSLGTAPNRGARFRHARQHVAVLRFETQMVPNERRPVSIGRS